MKLSIGCAIAVLALTPAAAQAPQPSCQGCPGTYIGQEDIDRYLKKAMAEQHHRSAGAGGRHRQVQRRRRHGAPDAADRAGAVVAEHDLVSEVYHVISGAATLVLGPIWSARQAPAGDATTTSGCSTVPGNNAASIRNGVSLRAEGRRRRGHPGRHRPLVHEDRRPHHLPDGAGRSRQGDPAQVAEAVRSVRRPARRRCRRRGTASRCRACTPRPSAHRAASSARARRRRRSRGRARRRRRCTLTFAGSMPSSLDRPPPPARRTPRSARTRSTSCSFQPAFFSDLARRLDRRHQQHLRRQAAGRLRDDARQRREAELLARARPTSRPAPRRRR